MRITSPYFTSLPQNATTWSNIVRASRMAPSALEAIMCSDSSSTETFSAVATLLRFPTMSGMLMRLKSYIWQRLSIVGSILCFSVVASMNMAWEGGSSRVLRNALNADAESMCTSSIMNTEYLPVWGGICTWSISVFMSSTPLFEAASSSWMQYDLPSWNERHDSHSPQGSKSGPGFEQLIVLAKMRAALVLPTPLGPQNR